MKTLIRGVFIAALLVCFGCSEQTDITPNIEAKKTLDVKQAKEAFVRDYTAAVEARSETTRAIEHIYYTLADTDYTPLWDKAKNTENEHVLSIDVPLYSVSGAFVSDTIGENMRMATQKLIVIQSKESGDTFSYLLTLCPDVACAEKYSDLNDVFTHLGDCSKFSGLAIYTSLAGELVAVNKFVNGAEAGYVYVGNPEADQHALHHQAEHLVEVMAYYLSSSPIEMTRGGGGDIGYENLCETCFSNPCLCESICLQCNKFLNPTGSDDPNLCQCNKETERCMWCGEEVIKGKQCDCGNEPFKECSDCHHFPCTCEPCPKCGYKTCTGCTDNEPEEPTPPYEPEEPEDPTEPSEPEEPENPEDSDRCEYCGSCCDGHCEAYCQECKQLKSDCTEHRCPSCNELYNDCTCK